MLTTCCWVAKLRIIKISKFFIPLSFPGSVEESLEKYFGRRPGSMPIVPSQLMENQVVVI